MKTVDLKTLLSVSPLDNATRTQVFEKLNTLNDDQKLQLSSACWSALAMQYQARFDFNKAQIISRITQGEKLDLKTEIDKISQELDKEYATLLSSAENEEQIEQVRQELSKYLRPKTNIPNLTNPQK